MAEKIIILSGKQFCGKDTVANILLQELSDFRRVALGDAIKLEYGAQKGLTLGEIEKDKHIYRPDLISLGDKRRAQDSDYWIKQVIAQPGNIIVPDVRMKRELEFFRAANAFCIRVEADKDKRALRGVLVKEDDLTECDLDDVQSWDYIIENNAEYDDLVEKSHELVSAIKKHFNA